MVINENKTLLVRCSACGRLRKYDLNLFNISRAIIKKFKCTCGETNVSLKTVDNKNYYLEIKCFVCGRKHFYKLNAKQLFCEDHMYRCIGNVKTCFIGNSKEANKILNMKKNELDNMLGDKEYENKFNNSHIIIACFNKLHRMVEEGNISCECGNKDMTLKVFSDRIELKCNNCNSVQIIFAETEDDLNVLLRKKKIKMEEHNIVCLDSLYEKNKDING